HDREVRPHMTVPRWPVAVGSAVHNLPNRPEGRVAPVYPLHLNPKEPIALDSEPRTFAFVGPKRCSRTSGAPQKSGAIRLGRGRPAASESSNAMRCAAYRSAKPSP